MLDSDPSKQFAYPAHGLRLDTREWLIVLFLVGAFVLIVPRLLIANEEFDPAPPYRIPYELSDDYQLYERHLAQAATRKEGGTFVIGDSVIWGEYVTADGTLSHFLTQELPDLPPFINGGLNGLFPLALEGLTEDFAAPIAGRKVLLHANLLWMTSAEADLSSPKEQKFNHERLVPQFSIDIPCYQAGFEQRLSHLLSRKVDLFGWTNHLRVCYFDQLSIPEWTLEPENHRKLPLAQFQASIPEELDDDSDRGIASPRHRAWNERSSRPRHFNWVGPDQSLQLAALQRMVANLREQDCSLFVLIGPLNEHMISKSSRSDYEAIQSGLISWLGEQDLSYLVPDALPSALYGDASHPLTDGYRLLAKELSHHPDFVRWLLAE